MTPALAPPPPARLHRSAVRWALIVGLLVVLGLGLVLAFVMTLAGGTPALYEQQVLWLFWANAAVALALVAVLAAAAVRLFVRLKRGKFGSRLLIRLAALFALVGVLPALLIYTVSYQFVSRSIEDWFDVRVEGALDAGLTLGRGTLEALSTDLTAKAQRAATRLADAGPVAPLTLERLREELGAQEVSLLGGAGQLVATAGVSGPMVLPDRPSPTLLRQARSAGVAGQFEGLDDEPAGGQRPAVRLRAMARVPNTALALSGEGERFLLITQGVSPTLVDQALAVQAAYREYQQRALARDGLRRTYIGTLTLTLVLAVFSAVLLALLFGTRLARPLLLLADGVRQVAEGDLTAKPVSAARDELGGLTRSFAEMTEQLGAARAQVQRGVQQLEGARTRLQTILDNLSSGVIVFNRERRIDTANPGATRILRAPLSAHLGQPLEQVPGMADFAAGVWQRFELHDTEPQAGERDHWQESFELRPDARGESQTTLLVRGARLPGGARLVVFDDITELLSGQRQAAWAEVARRLAHEIKNPLTPIQLSAERMKHKLEARLEGTERAMLVRSVDTIVNQVQAMKQLVNEFRDYARLPAAALTEVDLNALVAEVLALYADEADAGRLHARCEAALPPILGDASQLRQVVHNLVQNALDAVHGRPGGQVEVHTERSVDETGALRGARLKVRDNGTGFAEHVLGRAFEPYVTTKAKGTGLGLAVVKKIADEHGARVRLANLPGGGAQVSISFSRLAPARPLPAPPTAADAPRPATEA